MASIDYAGNTLFSSDRRAGESAAAFNRRVPLAIRAALEATFKYWLARYGRRHFQRAGFSLYESYKTNYKRSFQQGKMYNRSDRTMRLLAWQVSKGKNTALPLVKSGTVRDVILRGSYRFSGNNTNISASWPGLPRYFYQYRLKSNRGGATSDKVAMLLEYSVDEYEDLRRYFDEALNRELASLEKSQPTFGTVVL